MLAGTMTNLFRAQQMMMERIANISDRLKEMVRILVVRLSLMESLALCSQPNYWNYVFFFG